MTYLDIDGNSVTFPAIGEPTEIDTDTASLYTDQADGLMKIKNYAGNILQVGARGSWREQIAKTTVASPVASLTLSGWTQSEQFNKLRILVALRCDDSAYHNLTYRFNADATASNYVGSTKQFSASGSTNFTLGGANGAFAGMGGLFANSNQPAGFADLIDITISNYNQATIAKSWRGRINGDFANTSTPAPWGAFATGAFYGVAITSLYIAMSAGNIDTGSWYRVWVQ